MTSCSLYVYVCTNGTDTLVVTESFGATVASIGKDSEVTLWLLSSGDNPVRTFISLHDI